MTDFCVQSGGDGVYYAGVLDYWGLVRIEGRIDLDMNFSGEHVLSAVLVLCGAAMSLGLVSLAFKEKAAKRLLSLGKAALLFAAAGSAIAILMLARAFLKDDFSIAAVSQYSSRYMPIFYKISAVWAGAAGSLLLWTVLLIVFFALWTIRLGTSEVRFRGAALAIGSAVCLGFAAMLVFVARPFAESAAAVIDGAGMNPLLRNFWMMSHPPLLFIGYSAFLVPFAIVIAAGLTGGMDGILYKRLRWWLLFGICFLGMGIATGARWSYFVLGWGGYWAWDPVENASLLPWLLALAALHSLVGIGGAEKVRRWTAFLAPVPFILCLVATFVTRSGVLQSVHAFGENVMSRVLLIFIGLCGLLWLAGIVAALKRGTAIAAVPEEKAGLKRSDLLFWANAILIFAAAVIGIATFWPVISRAAENTSMGVALGRGFYDKVISVVGIALALGVGLMAIIGGFRKRVIGYAIAGLIFAVVVYFFFPGNLLLSLASGICVFSFAAISVRGSFRAGDIAHIGLLLLIVSAGFSAMEKGATAQLRKGEAVEFGGYQLGYEFFDHRFDSDITGVGPRIMLQKDGFAKNLWPHNNIYPDGRKTSQAAIYSGLLDDVYVIFEGVEMDGGVSLEIRLKPMMTGLWLGCLLIIGGAGWGFLSKRQKSS